ncbi:MAG TPA: hypothetical protein VF017_17240 [Thermoanaerobaculia bacterium]|nr:hypothetical protein [Thermoanaerobaculia bacterium]
MEPAPSSPRTGATLALVAGLVLVGMLPLGAESAASAAPPDPTKEALELVKLVCEILALILGGLWVWFNYFRGRTHRPRLEPKILARLVPANGKTFVKWTVQVKNVGLSKVEIQQKGTGLRVLYLDYAKPRPEPQHLVTLSVLEAHGWIEPGETVEDSGITQLPVADAAAQLELVLTGKRTMWGAKTIVTAEPPKEGGAS